MPGADPARPPLSGHDRAGGYLEPESLSLLLILVALAPLDAFDTSCNSWWPSSVPRAIFFLRQVLGPALGHCQTSLRIAILTFPVFIVTCLLAPTLTVLLFGAR